MDWLRQLERLANSSMLSSCCAARSRLKLGWTLAFWSADSGWTPLADRPGGLLLLIHARSALSCAVARNLPSARPQPAVGCSLPCCPPWRAAAPISRSPPGADAGPSSASRPARNPAPWETLGNCCAWGSVQLGARCRSGPWWSTAASPNWASTSGHPCVTLFHRPTFCC